ncbi:MAG TPA: gamma-glutamyl ligase, partial [Methanobacterium sp.]|nr:gamma-glutamyl ligase [Methanobacterium sp.]
DKPGEVTADIAAKISNNVGKEVVVTIIDTDATYEFLGRLFTSLPIAARGIKANFGFFGYLLGRFSKIKGPTPLGVSKDLDIDTLMEIAKIADDYQMKNKNSMETVYDMGNTFNKQIDEVTIEMLNSIEHTPAIVIRKL